MPSRPVSLTIIAWLLILAGVFAFYTAATMDSNEALLRTIEQTGRPLRFHQFIQCANGIVAFASAYGVLKGQPWSRVFLIVWQAITLALSLLPPVMLGVVIFNIVVTGIIAFLLYRQAANRWFDATGFQIRRRGA